MKKFGASFRLIVVITCTLLVGGSSTTVAFADSPPASSPVVTSVQSASPIVTSVQAAPFEDQASLAGGSVVAGGQTLSPNSLACSTSTDFTYKTEKCINPSSTNVYVSGRNESTSTFNGHIELTYNGSHLTNTVVVSYGSNAYNIGGTFPHGTYCVILWRSNGSGGQANQGNVCEVL
jgi:hypothetical protein